MNPPAARRSSILVTGLALLVTGAGCNNERHAVPTAQVESAPAPVAAPTGLQVQLAGSTANIAWKAPTDLAAPLTGFDLYVDDEAAVRLAPNVHRKSVGNWKAGSSHFVQVVAVSGSDQSSPVDVTVDVPYPPQPKVAVPQGATPAVSTPTSQEVTPAQDAGGEAIIGTLKLLDATMNGVDEPSGRFTPNTGDCAPNHQGYEDLHNGTQVVVKDAQGTVVGVGQLTRGRLSDTHTEQRGTGLEKGILAPHIQTWGYCTWDLTVSYRGGSDFYGVEVSHRGSTQFSAADLAGGRVKVSVGNDGQ